MTPKYGEAELPRKEQSLRKKVKVLRYLIFLRYLVFFRRALNF